MKLSIKSVWLFIFLKLILSVECNGVSITEIRFSVFITKYYSNEHWTFGEIKYKIWKYNKFYVFSLFLLRTVKNKRLLLKMLVTSNSFMCKKKKYTHQIIYTVEIFYMYFVQHKMKTITFCKTNIFIIILFSHKVWLPL